MITVRSLGFIITSLVFFSCGNDYYPKPNAQLRLDYPSPHYKTVYTNLPFTFEKNTLANTKTVDNSSYSVTIQYPKLKATIYLNYKKVNNNLYNLLRDAQNLTQKHTLKADEISQTPFINKASNVYGMFYEVGGNAASQSQFYATDSTTHFLSGSLYFYAKPNYDSIYPAAVYLKKDVKHLMESLQWK